MQTCFADDDCKGGKCFGTFVGKCDRGGCKNFFMFQSDADCGGLKGACNKQIKHLNANASRKTLLSYLNQ
ncbi:unnamed protein product [Heligmosomoides polygyrus]|uniref:C8 domain-containing protein n=1 Tax=Heligmosomoides polygyrus TaxID=6339 RepID=A0A183FJZ9_HELPZ|nr:unnamed protein product [Heligmosomoides polygyrus]